MRLSDIFQKVREINEGRINKIIEQILQPRQ